MPVEIALVMWKWRLSWASSISRSQVGNDFQQARGNQSFRHFHMSTISTPYGGDRPTLNVVGQPRAVGAETTARSAVSSSVFASKIAPWQSPTDRDLPLPEW